MFAFISGRRSGKTWQVAKWFWENPSERGILVADEKHKREMLRALQYTMPATLDEYHTNHFYRSSILVAGEHQGYRGRYPFREIGIDDLDRVLGRMFGQYGQVEMVTATATLVSPPPFLHTRNLFNDDKDTVDGDIVDSYEVEGRRALPRAATGSGVEDSGSTIQSGTASYPRSGSGRNYRLDV